MDKKKLTGRQILNQLEKYCNGSQIKMDKTPEDWDKGYNSGVKNVREFARKLRKEC